MTSGLLGFLFSCVSGTADLPEVLVPGRQARPADRRTTRSRSSTTGLLPGKLGTSPFDAEGVPVAADGASFEKGSSKTYLCNTYAARKLQLNIHGQRGRRRRRPEQFLSRAGPAFARGHHPLLRKGPAPDPDARARTESRHGRHLPGRVRPVDRKRRDRLSRLRNHDLGQPGELLKNVEMVGNDLEFRGSICGPTIKVAEMIDRRT